MLLPDETVTTPKGTYQVDYKSSKSKNEDVLFIKGRYYRNRKQINSVPQTKMTWAYSFSFQKPHKEGNPLDFKGNINQMRYIRVYHFLGSKLSQQRSPGQFQRNLYILQRYSLPVRPRQSKLIKRITFRIIQCSSPW